jgi:glycosyltransferase involved in cell wall biosynthesis
MRSDPLEVGPLKVSIVTSTRNRPKDVGHLLLSIERQAGHVSEMIVVDQSDTEATKNVVDGFADKLPLHYIPDERRGLSRGRNLGLTKVSGEIVAFPDDDCIYPPDTLARVVRAFMEDPSLGIYTGMSITEHGVPSQGRWSLERRAIDRFNIWTTQTSYTTFYRKSALDRAGTFNESLGVGSGTIWGAGEETELMLRALRKNAKGLYDPELRIVHPEPLAIFDAYTIDRGRRYNRGFGRVLRLGEYPFWFAAYMTARPLIGVVPALLSGDWGRVRYRYIAFRERLLGWNDA